MTHIENVPHILQYGITHYSSQNKSNDFVPIGDGSLINSRSQFIMPNGRKLGEYIPFYFGVRMPMLYVIQNGFNGVKAVSAKDIVYCITTVEAITKSGLDYIFSNGHAVDNFSDFFDRKDIDRVEEIVDFAAVKAQYWKKDTDLDLKRRKEAEFLVMGDIPVEAVLGFAVYNNESAQKIQQMANFANKKIVIKPNYYF